RVKSGAGGRPIACAPVRSSGKRIWGSIMPLLEVDRLHARYDYAPVVHGVSFSVDAGEIVRIFRRNGAGKTTTLRTIMGWLRPSQGRIVFEVEAIEGMWPYRVCRTGIAFIPGDRRLCARLRGGGQH